MSKKVMHLSVGLLLFVGLLAFPVHADLGLQQTLSDQGVQALGAAVKAAAEAVYAGTSDPAQIQSQLVAILNEAEATGDEGAIRYAIVAVMMVGGVENLGLSKDAINNSNVFANHPEVTAFTITATEKLISSGGGDAQMGGGEQLGGGEGGGSEDPNSLGGDDPNPFDPGTETTPFGRIEDRDSAATRI